MPAQPAPAQPASAPPIAFDNSYARLPARFYARLDPAPASRPSLIRLNEPLAEALGLDAGWLASPQGVAALAGAAAPPGAAPLAMVYAGHQFGGFSPQLGDGRAMLLGEIVTPDGARRDIHLKGSGPTPFARRGDGRAALGPVLRELLVAEAMHALGAPTTRSLAAVATGDMVYRETPQPGAVLTRVAASHLRVGTFEYFYARQDLEGLRTLADYAVARHQPEAAEGPTPHLDLLRGVIARQAALIARWQMLGFIHGVMNTDNMTISGETIDYGPCAFMDHYDPGRVFSSIDHGGRYAYGNQGRIGLWNLARLAQALLPLLGADEAAGLEAAQEALDAYPGLFQQAWTEGMRAKLGLTTARDGDADLAQDLLGLMADAQADFTLCFRALCDDASAPQGAPAAAAHFADKTAFADWTARWRSRLAQEPAAPAERRAAMRSANPAFIPRNHQVEAALAAAHEGDLAPFDRLATVLSRPYDDQPDAAAYAAPPKPEEVVQATFCGT